MKTLAGIFFIGLLAVTSQAQQTTVQQELPDVAILKISWSKERIPGWENNSFGQSYETYETMRTRIADERLLQDAKNRNDKREVARLERNVKVRDDAALNNKKARETPPPRDGYRYKVSLKNTGAKTIKVIDWDYVFLDPETKNEIARHQFTSEEKIHPGKNKQLEVFILSPPTKTVSAKALDKKERTFFDERVEVARIEYSDGSVWQQP